jgi:hypothetical protein
MLKKINVTLIKLNQRQVWQMTDPCPHCGQVHALDAGTGTGIAYLGGRSLPCGCIAELVAVESKRKKKKP